MRIDDIRTFLAVGALSVAFCAAQTGEAHKTAGHAMVTPAQAQWQAAGPPLPPGAQLTVFEGDPSKAGAPYTIGLRMPSGYKIPPHWHPADAAVVVVKGAFVMGLGDKFDASKGTEMPPGTYMRISKGVRHFEWTKGETIIYIYGLGPLDTIYVNPSDGPRDSGAARR
jgi:hypothetical protein